jgi:hypothetical protein
MRNPLLGNSGVRVFQECSGDRQSSPPSNAAPAVSSSLALIAELHPPVLQTGVRYTGKYAVSFRSEYIVANSRDPECAAARVLRGCGITGKVKVIDANTGRCRSVINIELAARVVAEEGPCGPRFVKFRQQTVGDRSPSHEEHLPYMVTSVGGSP